MCGPPLTQVRRRRGGSADVEGRRGERIGKWMGACWFWVSTQNNGGSSTGMGARAPILRAPKIIGARALIFWEVW